MYCTYSFYLFLTSRTTTIIMMMKNGYRNKHGDQDTDAIIHGALLMLDPVPGGSHLVKRGMTFFEISDAERFSGQI